MTNKSTNISVKAYAHIRESLLNSGTYVGQKIPHLELGQKLGISHTPLREALFRLATEGLIDHEIFKGFYLAEITLEEAREIYDARELIEPHLTEKAAKIMDDNRVKSFTKILDDYKRLVPEGYSRKRLLIDKKFHMQIAQLAGNKILTQILNQMYDKLILKRPVQHLSPARAEEAYAEHTQILDVLKMKNGKLAAKFMRNHIRQQRDFVLNDIMRRQRESAFKGLRRVT